MTPILHHGSTQLGSKSSSGIFNRELEQLDGLVTRSDEYLTIQVRKYYVFAIEHKNTNILLDFELLRERHGGRKRITRTANFAAGLD